MLFFDHLTAVASGFSRHYKHWFLGVAAVLVITLTIISLQSLTIMQVFEAKTLDLRFGLNQLAEDADEVVMIGIDDASLKFFRDNGVSWPWPRNFYAHVVEYLTRCGAKVVIFDLLFYQPDLDRSESGGQETDREFAQAMAKNGHVILGAQLSEDVLGFDTDLEAIGLQLSFPGYSMPSSYRSILAPIAPLSQAAAGLGIINIGADPDGIIRKVPLIYGLGDKILPQMAIAAFLVSDATDGRYLPERGLLELGDTKVPMDDNGDYQIYWYGRKDLCQSIDCIPFAAAIQSASADMFGQEPVIDAQRFKDKLVVIGATAAGLMDLKPTPTADIAPGMEIWATILLNLIHQDFIRNVHWSWDMLRTLLVTYAAFMLITRLSGVKAHAMALCLPVVTVVDGLYFWRYHQLALSLTIPFLGFLATYTYTTTMGYLVEGRSRRKISRAMSRYLHPDLVRIIARDPDRVEMGGSEIEATVLFSDIYNFTTISENFTPEELVSHLNCYFSDLSGFVLDHGGMLDKYTGDGIMALFGAPLPREDHAFLACRAALDHRNFSRKLLQKTPPDIADDFHQGTRIGLHSGKIVAGNIGSARRMDYTAIGDTVNLAARLEGVNKIYKTQIILSEDCYQMVRDRFLCRELDYLRVKGKHTPTRIYELIDEKNQETRYNWIETYENALAIYRQGNFEAAAELFTTLMQPPASDSASAVMLDRCRYLIEHPPETWDGILTLEVK